MEIHSENDQMNITQESKDYSKTTLSLSRM